MEILKTDLDKLTIALELNISKDDYFPKIDNALKDISKRATIPGFRKGHIPKGYLRKMYGKSVFAEEMNKLVQENLFEYLKKEEINFIGEPLPGNTDQPEFEFDTAPDYSFKFKLGLRPEVDYDKLIALELQNYEIEVTEKRVDEWIDSVKQQYGNVVDKEVSDENSMVYGNIEALDDSGNVIADDKTAEEKPILVSTIKDEEVKKSFVGLNVNQILSFEPGKVSENDTDLASLLSVDKEELDKISDKYQISVTKITNFEKAELNEELFNKVDPEGNIKTEEDLRSRAKENIAAGDKNMTKQEFAKSSIETLSEKLEIELPEAFLKEWLQKEEEKYTDEYIEKNWDDLKKQFMSDIILSEIASKNEIAVDDKEIDTAITYEIFRMMYSYQMPMDKASEWIEEAKKDPNRRRQIEDSLIKDKAIDKLIENGNITSKSISYEDFIELTKTVEPEIAENNSDKENNQEKDNTEPKAQNEKE